MTALISATSLAAEALGMTDKIDAIATRSTESSDGYRLRDPRGFRYEGRHDLQVGQHPRLPLVGTDYRNNEPADGAYSATYDPSDRARGLLQARRVGIVRAEVAERSESTAYGQTTDANRPRGIDHPLAFD